MRVLGASSEAEMVATFLLGELTSERFEPDLRTAMIDIGVDEAILSSPDLANAAENVARRMLLGATRGYGHGRWLFDATWPAEVDWVRAVLAPADLARVRYVQYEYWEQLSGGSRLALDAAARIRSGIEVFGVPNDRFLHAADAVGLGERFPPLILAGAGLGAGDDLVAVEGNLRLTAYALAGFPVEVDALVGTSPLMHPWAK